MSSVEPGDWMVAKANPSAYLEVAEVTREGGIEYMKVRTGQQEQQVSKRYLLACWQHLEET
ncbi:hypothetical protein DEI99_005160 [Curtobacterium sp. MCLR17_036]|uniref:hypothetical protein n=1 Tax=Curtobacterium sp. MCLR17_036 TaxID=2175620 RepID=UPI0015E88FEA|nr:hypothetical protein [Curtobacterium sp. MCLR17_036]WIE65928.1 hypothetical protein DEI99_005160 [Curtobacterium sp. MCLR17_036]